jgi:hypothetical protein
MESIVSQLSYFPVKREDKEKFVSLLVDEILSGDRNPIKAEIYLQSMLSIIKSVRVKVKDYVMSEAGKYAKKSFAFDGLNLTVAAKVTYDYESCNDSVYNDLKKKIEEREAFLKNLNQEVVNPDTGEVILRPVKKVTDYLKITD